jgi:hypothetical protein
MTAGVDVELSPGSQVSKLTYMIIIVSSMPIMTPLIARQAHIMKNIYILSSCKFILNDQVIINFKQ